MPNRHPSRPHWLALTLALGLAVPAFAQRTDPNMNGWPTNDRSTSGDNSAVPSGRASDSTPMNRADPGLDEANRPAKPAHRHKKTSPNKDGQSPRGGDTASSPSDGNAQPGSSDRRRPGAGSTPGTNSDTGTGSGTGTGTGTGGSSGIPR